MEDGIKDDEDYFSDDPVNNHFAFAGNKLISCNTSAIGRVKIPSYYNGIPTRDRV